ncbi:hypothetical protein CHGG_01885 [Chaetomium globosum CBS 148.51]|uniref:FK506-binding protein n=1 Tax=Chaetomium globosum (strain ATCC 6205 / CBS 148.51 / DSM 1962 / NBRC 6347 / NRRL 1970) TaxID=306901 RepID=Q2HD19_CHAGB|nr:uncharacterized protein CHGG_01885 [Chaetomium globosum CBS 148.51]EAQ93650.1 hypothetical protein CHGG_01885 [Chaetomium globosum CBS 148.51]
MSPLLPVAVYGLEIPTGELLVPAEIEFPATIRITMAAIDPTAAPETDGQGNVPSVPRSTLKIYKANVDEDDDDEDDYLESLIGGGDDDDESDDEDEEANGGPSDPSKSSKARRAAAIKKILEATQEDSDDEMEDAKPNAAKSKGKSKASDEDEEESDEEDDDGPDANMEEYVVCTLDTERTYQQPIDITVGEGEKIFFSVKGTHAVYLTGNYVVPQDEEEDDDEEYSDDEYDLPPGLEDVDSDEMSDELDDIDGTPRIKEIDTDEEEAPKLVQTKKSKKRAAEEEAEGLDEIMAKDDKKLSKKQKKLKNNQGEAVAAEAKAKESAAKGDKKVQFAKNLEQGPTGPAKDKAENKGDKKGATGGVRVVQGVTVDDRKAGTGRTAKSGDKVGMRYIGKLQNGKVFDSNKKGTPFSFKIGKGEVIKGWDIGIAGMAVGGERRLTIPAHLAYGSRAIPGIPANSTLIFDVKLLEIK